MNTRLLASLCLVALAAIACNFSFQQEAPLPPITDTPTQGIFSTDTLGPSETSTANIAVEEVELPDSGNEKCDITVDYDPAKHWAYTGMPIKKNLSFTFNGQTLRIDGSFPWVPVEGPVNTTKNSFIGTGSGTVAERPDVSVSGEGNFRSGAAEGLVDFSFQYTMGANKELPQEEPIIFNFECSGVANQ